MPIIYCHCCFLMSRRSPRSTRTYTLFPYSTRFLSGRSGAEVMSRRIAYDAPVTKTLIEQDDSLAPVCVLQFEFPPMNCAIGHLEGDVEPKLFTQKLRYILPVALMIPVVEDPIRHTVFLQRL